MLWGKWLVELIPYHRNTIRQWEEFHDRSIAHAASDKAEMERLQADLSKAAEARIRAEDDARSANVRAERAHEELTSVRQQLIEAHQRVADFMALATTGGRRAIFSKPENVTPISEAPVNLPGRMQARDLAVAMDRAAHVADMNRRSQSDTPEEAKAKADIAKTVEQEMLAG